MAPYARPSRRRGRLFLRHPRRGMVFQIFNADVRLRLESSGRPLACSRCREPGTTTECAFNVFCAKCCREMHPIIYRSGKVDVDGRVDWRSFAPAPKTTGLQ